MLPWKVGFALAGGTRAGRTQVDGASVMGRMGFVGEWQGQGEAWWLVL